MSTEGGGEFETKVPFREKQRIGRRSQLGAGDGMSHETRVSISRSAGDTSAGHEDEDQVLTEPLLTDECKHRAIQLQRPLICQQDTDLGSSSR